ncbi:MAG: glycerate kinase, partial [Firmicutes bacterium]|nr:glycerate kinase [Bacillota bacterium]
GGEADVMPMADGGEGTQDALRATFPQMLQIPAKRVDAYGRLGRGHYVRLGRTALVEASVGSGFIEASQRPQGALETTSLGTGQLVQAALSDPEVDDVVVALGGTGSVDAGLGFLSGLGWQFYDAHGGLVKPTASGLSSIAFIEGEEPSKPIVGWCDVFVPLLGERGSVRLFGPQKGVEPSDMTALEAHMGAFVAVLERHLGRSGLAKHLGAGAAGGMGMAIAALGGALLSGAEQIAKLAGLDHRLRGVDLCLTGEGRLDAQTEEGKVVATVCRHAKSHGVPTVVLAGSVDLQTVTWLDALDAYAFSVVPGPMALASAIAETERLLEASALSVVSLARRLGLGEEPAHSR